MMKTLLTFLLAIYFLMTAAPAMAASTEAGPRLLILCYHDIPKEVKRDKYGVDRESFVGQIEYLRTHGYHFVGLADVVAARDGVKPLPAKPVMLTFDDAYETYYSFVEPLLNEYGYPSMLGVVTSWMEKAPDKLPAKLMSWQMLREVAADPLVTVASHTDDLHHAVLYNPFGNTGWAAASRMFDPATNTYETESTFRARINRDITTSRKLLKEKGGVDVKALVWPYGQCNGIGMEEARKAGIDIAFSLEDVLADVHAPGALPRVLLVQNPSIQDFISALKKDFDATVQQRIVQVDLDMVYDKNPKQEGRNLDALVERLYRMKPSAVYLQAFSDDAGTGNVAAVYFPSRILPMKADLFNRVVNQLSVRGIEVYAWMPMLSIVLPDKDKTRELRVRLRDARGERVSDASYQRLSPFAPESRRLLQDLYEDMAQNARISGVAFLDDGYLNDQEDFHLSALGEYRKIAGADDVPYSQLTSTQKQAWMERRTKALDDLSIALMESVRKYRPLAKFARTLYAPVLTDPESQEWFSQSYAGSLKLYDQVVVMAYPYMEDIVFTDPWMRKLVRLAAQFPDGLAKTTFKLQAYDWKEKQWVPSKRLLRWMRILVSEGARNIGYYPDDAITNKPDLETVKPMMSTEDFPLTRVPESSQEDPYR
ncbi:MAG: poly-beta-1,6-N-acetyl-D-glucosamine N-deacetylase PgaB [Candidatus Omnitrophota bacterium]